MENKLEIIEIMLYDVRCDSLRDLLKQWTEFR
jgi:hypothetical protein